MGTTENKQLMENIFAQLELGNGRPLVERLAEDCRWTVMGTTPWSGTYDGKQAILNELLTPLFARFANQYTNTAHRFIADREYVVVECHGRVTTKEGLLYDNRYCWVCRISEGQLHELIEYLDTELLASTLGDRERDASGRL
jgi:ketosteroid isomerase-like protein